MDEHQREYAFNVQMALEEIAHVAAANYATKSEMVFALAYIFKKANAVLDAYPPVDSPTKPA